MTRLAATCFLLFWITGQLVPACLYISEQSKEVVWMIEKHENEQKESEETEFGEMEFILTPSVHVHGLPDILGHKGLIYFSDHSATSPADIVLPPPEPRV